MPDLNQSLQGRDLGHLRIVAQFWNIELSAPDARVGMQRLTPALLERKRVKEGVEALPAEARAALDDLLRHEGRIPWPLFTRRYGAVREMGPARRDRERPYANSPSTAETLWYRALVARSFFDSPAGPEEFAYIPDDLLTLIPRPELEGAAPLGRPASPAERLFPIPASDRIVDDACTLLAALRLGLDSETLAASLPSASSASVPLSPDLLKSLLAAAGLLDASGLPQPEPARLFLESPRADALATLARAWLRSSAFNELRLLPGLSVEGEWQNDPLRARGAVLDFLSGVPAKGRYWSLAAFVAAVRQAHPDFQRPAGDYDSWFLRDERSGEFLRGFEHWDAVDGALIRYLVGGPLYWFGILDLAASASEAPVSAFRFTNWAVALLGGSAPEGLAAEESALLVKSDGQIFAPRLAPRLVRYQVARFCAWEGLKDDVYRYRLTPASLERARQQGLRLSHLLALMRRHAPALPPNLMKALDRWEEHGSEARLEQVMVLRLSSPDLLQTLRASRAARFLGDPLGPTTVIVKPGAWEKVMAVLLELGYLGEIREMLGP
ncbi:MAG TPA: helicase-associated domain-containing protein [Anaerolineales bacterium]